MSETSLQPCFVLHQRDYQNSSRILDVLTRNHGRLALVAKGVRRPTSKGRSLLRQFLPLEVSWVGRGPLFTLTGIDAVPATASLAGLPLLCGFYVNELLLRLVPAADPNPELYDDYGQCLSDLSRDCLGKGLRIFEKRLLEHLGYALNLEYDDSNECAIRSGAYYVFEPDKGPREVNDRGADGYSGGSLLSLATEDLQDERSLADARRLLRAALDVHLGGKPLKSRDVLIAMKKMIA
ncbi:MAG: DNA repair protein RecO [Pseudomonadota bacterium]